MVKNIILYTKRHIPHGVGIKIYLMKQELLAVWKKRSASRDELFKAMQAWCQEAERSGIRALEEFAESLKQYSTKMA